MGFAMQFGDQPVEIAALGQVVSVAPVITRYKIFLFKGAAGAHGDGFLADTKMDGRFHRVPVIGDDSNDESGSYRGFLTGRPAGTVTNFKAGGTHKWVSERTSQLSKSEQATRQAQTLQQQKAKDRHKQAQRRIDSRWRSARKRDRGTRLATGRRHR